MKELTTTSYALLGLLAIRPWSAYELAVQMRRGFAWYWPRAERAIYDEPKHLVARGLAVADVALRGRQRRTVYDITPAGRDQLRTWLEQPSGRPHMEAEALVRLTFLEHDRPDDIALALDALRDAADELEAIVHRVSGEYLAGRGPFPQRLPQIALTGRFLDEMASMLRGYVAFAEELTSSSGDHAAALAALQDLHDRTSEAKG